MKPIYSLAFTAVLALAQEHVITFSSSSPATAPNGAVSYVNFARTTEAAVKGAPYSGDTITETVQTLGDGNRITRTNRSSFARDSEGRTRRESSIEGLGVVGKTDSPLVSIFIYDPVAKINYTLDPKSKIAFKSSSGTAVGAIRMPSTKPMGLMEDVIIERAVPPAAGSDPVAHKIEAEAVHTQTIRSVRLNEATGTAARAQQNLKKEDLGARNVEGLAAKGTRLTMTIPAGELGNERPIEVVTETWYSDELKASVLVKHTDPRMGETTTRLSNVRLGEPPSSLFEPPADYKVEQGGMKTRSDMPATIRVHEDR